MSEIIYDGRFYRFSADTRLQPRFTHNDTVYIDADEGDYVYKNIFSLEFQSGPIPEYGVNGLTNELLLEIIIERTKRLNAMFPCDENYQAIAAMEEARAWLEVRTQRRKAMGIEGKHEEKAA